MLRRVTYQGEYDFSPMQTGPCRVWRVDQLLLAELLSLAYLEHSSRINSVCTLPHDDVC